MRSRKSVSREDFSLQAQDFETGKEKQKYLPQTIPYYYGIIFCFVLLLLFAFVDFIDQRLPTPLMKKDEVRLAKVLTYLCIFLNIMYNVKFAYFT